MNKQSLNTFINGMNKDIDKSVISKDTYIDAYNFRIVTSEGSSTGAFENIKGNKIIGATGLLPVGQLICGAERIRDSIILFSTDNTTATPTHGVGNSMIHELILDKDLEDVDSITLLYDDNLNAGLGDDTLDFSIANKIKCVSKYETPNIQKIYFTDSYNNLRYFNKEDNLTIDGTAYSVNNYMETTMFELLPAFIPSKPILKDIIGGSLNSGMVQYSYQLYRLNGATTAFSPVSDMIHIVSDNDFSTNTLSYSGDSESINTGKGCKVSVTNNNDGYNRLRLVRLHHSTLNSIPVITVSNEIEISTTAGTVEIYDTGESISSLTLDEFNISSTELFKCEDIASKDNRLFVANIEKTEFEVDDWDSRAVRFKAGSTATVYNSDDSSRVILANLSNWDDPSTGYIAGHDGINKFNDPDNDGNASYQWMYQANGSTLGAEGKNIKIDFESDDIILDNSPKDTNFYTTSPTSATDKSYKGYASPWKGGHLSWQRDEVYRLAVTFGNDRGQVSAPSWICDLRMPSLHDDDFINSSTVTVEPSHLSDSRVATRLYPRIYFKNFPTNATWAQIHRIKRDRSDRFVVTQALAIPTKDNGVGNNYAPTTLDYTLTPSNGVELVKLVSPEINVTKNISKQSNDYLDYLTTFTSDVTVSTSTYGNYLKSNIYKLKTNTRVAFSTSNISTISDAIPITPDSSTDTYTVIDGKKYNNYVASPSYSKGSSGLLVAYDNTSWAAEGKNYVVVNYKSNVYGSQYGGHTYEARALNLYVPCSDIIMSTAVTTWVDISYGDTFINYFDVSNQLVDLSRSTHEVSYATAAYVPLESSINCDLIHSSSSAHLNVGLSYSDIRQEYAGSHVFDVYDNDNYNPVYDQVDDLYLYNTVYSQQTIAQYALSEMIDTPSEIKFDSLIKASNIKYTGENSDSWTTFNTNEEIEVDSNYGSVNAIATVNDKLMFWQDDAFGVLSVNTRSLIQDGSNAQLALGTGGVLDRYDYMSSTIGILDKFSIVQSNYAVYWFYDKDYSIYRFDNKLTNLTKEKGLLSWFKNNYTSSHSVHGIYDRAYDDIIFTLYEDFDNGYTIAFNEQTDQFVSFYSFVPRMYIDYKDGYLSLKDYVSDTYSYVFLHNSNINPRGRFYSLVDYDVADAANTFDSTVKLLYNEGYPATKVYDNIFYNSNAYDETTDVEQYNDTFSSVRCYNDYQNTDWVDLVYGTNLMRRDRSWTLHVPRNLVTIDYNSGGNIFTPANIDSGATKVWHERIRDKYVVVDLVFDNTSENRFVVPFIGIKSRISYR